MKNSSVLWYSLAFIVVLLITLTVIVLSEFKPMLNSGRVEYIVVSLTLLLGCLAIKLPKNRQVKLSKFSFYALYVVLFCIVIHFICNSINIYHVWTLPSVFYTFKLYRLVSLNPLFICQVVFLCATLALFLPLKRKIPSLNNHKLIVSAVAILLVVFFVHVELAFSTAYRDTTQVLLNVNTPFEERFTYRLGGADYYGWVWPYTQFIIRHTPEDATILIPTQSNVWKMEGNAAYIRWFLYPRKTTHINTDGSLPQNVEYVLIALGECNEGDCGWPKISIPKDNIEFIALIDRKTLNETVLTNTDYSLDTSLYTWGIIKLRK